jgi:hypothetical protein
MKCPLLWRDFRERCLREANMNYYPQSPGERAKKIQEVILQAKAMMITRWQVAEIFAKLTFLRSVG